MKKIISSILSVAMILSAVNTFAAEYAGKTETPLEGAVAETPASEKFTYGGKNFIILDSEKKQDKTYYFVLCDETYGKRKFDFDGIAYWNPASTNNMANWLNNDFYENGNDTYALPSGIKNYIDKTHVWTTEPVKGLAGFTEETQTIAPLALLSDSEWKQYVNKIGQNVETVWFLRTARSDKNETGKILATGSSYPLGTNEEVSASGIKRGIRPAFYLSEDFFRNEKMTNIGGNVAILIADILNEDLYTKEELDKIYESPSAEITNVDGGIKSGNTMEVEYTYNCKITEGDTEIKWYLSDTKDGEEFILAGEGKTILLTDSMRGKYIFAKVKPKSISKVNAYGTEIKSDVFGPIYIDVDVSDAIQEIKGSSEPFSVIEKYSYIFNIALDNSITDKNNAESIFKSIDFGDLPETQKAYTDAITLQKINEAETASEISSLLANLDGVSEYKQNERLINAVRSKKYNKYGDFVKDAEDAIILIRWDGASTIELIEILNENKEYFSINALSASNIKELAKNLYGTTFDTTNLLKEAVSKEAEMIKKNSADIDNEPLLGLAPAGRVIKASPNAVDDTPEGIIFEAYGKKFAILDEIEKNDKKYYFVLSMDKYGKCKFDRTPGATGSTAVAKWDVDDENNIAHWLNNDFLENGNGGNKLPEMIVKYIDTQHIWHTEPMKGLEGFSTETLTVSPLAVMADYEYRKYIDKIGCNDVMNAWMRTARTSDAAGWGNVLFINASGGLTGAYGAHSDAMQLVPEFYLSQDFFKNAVVTRMGADLQKQLDEYINTSLYSGDALNSVIEPPIAKEIALNGNPAVGEVLKASYVYESLFDENNSVISWYAADTPDGVYEKIGTGASFTLTDEHENKYIKVGVQPISISKANPNGKEVISDGYIGKIYGDADIDVMLKEISGSPYETILSVIDNYKPILNIDTTLSQFDTESRENISKYLADEAFASIENVKNKFYAYCVLEEINISDDSLIDGLLHNSALKLDTSFYDRLTDKNSVIQKLSDKYTKLDDFYNDFFEAVACVEFNTATRENIVSLLKDYKQKLTPSVENYTDYQLNQIGVAMLERTYSNFSGINTAYNSGINALKNISAGGSSSSGSGGGSSGGSKVTNPMKAVVPVSEAKSEVILKYFTDLSDAAWAQRSILTLSEKNIVSGYPDGTFAPNNTLTREEFVTIIVKAFDIPDGADAGFDDVDGTAWYSKYVNAAYSQGIISGIGGNMFGVGQTISREEAYTILYRMIGNNEVSEEPEGFADIDRVSDYAKNAIAYMVKENILAGSDNMLSPKADTTRAMAAQIICTILEKQGAV